MASLRDLRVEAAAIAGVKGMIRVEEKEKDKKAQEKGETAIKVRAKDALSRRRLVLLPELRVVFLQASVVNRALVVLVAVNYDTISRSTLNRITM